MAKTKEQPISDIDKLLESMEDETDALAVLTKEDDEPKERKAVSPKDFIRGYFYGTYHIPSMKHADKREEVSFDVNVLIPRQVLTNKLNFQAYFRRFFKERMSRKDNRFIRFGKIYFKNARNLDGSLINDPRTFSPDELKVFATKKGWNIDFELFNGYELRDVIFHYFLPDNGQPEIEAFKAYQEKIRRKYGAESLVRNQLMDLPDDEIMRSNE